MAAGRAAGARKALLVMKEVEYPHEDEMKGHDATRLRKQSAVLVEEPILCKNKTRRAKAYEPSYYGIPGDL